MDGVNITINGRQVVARQGQTVMEAAADAGIDIPSLCHHPALKPEGACRVCLVEIEKQRTLQPACTFPVSKGLVIRTESDKAVAARKFALQMIFSERAHYCMYCQMSGSDATTDCELQKLAYRYGINSWEYAPRYQQPWPVDATRPYFVVDQSRCILCRRCIRACAQLAANHALGVQQRGSRTIVCADDGVPFGQSTCVSCGTCLQVCPTGALIDRRSAYLGHETEIKRTKTTCMGCAVGCGIEACTRDNHVLRIEGDWNSDQGGLLCAAGRFEAIEPRGQRILWPLVRHNGELAETSWDKALALIADRFKQVHRVAGLVSPRTTNEGLAAFGCFFNEALGSGEVSLLHGDVPPLGLGSPATFQDVTAADCIVVLGGEPLEQQQVVGYLIKRAIDREAKLVVVHDGKTGLDDLAQLRLGLQNISQGQAEPFEMLRLTYHLRVDGLTKLKAAVESAERPVILYGGGLSTTVCAALRGLPAKVRFLPLVDGTNAAGAQRLGLGVHPVRGEALYVLAGDDKANGRQLPPARFTVVQSAYHSPWTQAADVVLPARVWTEKQGHIINLEGRTLPVVPLVEAPKSVHSDWMALLMLSVRIGAPLPLETIPGAPVIEPVAKEAVR